MKPAPTALLIAALLLADAGSPARAGDGDGDRVSLGEAIAALAKEAAVPIVIEPGLGGEVASPDAALPWEDRLRAIAAEAGAGVERVGREARLLRPRPTVTMEVKGADLATLLGMIARNTGARIIAAPLPDRRIDVAWKAEPLEEALAIVAAEADLVVEPSGPLLYLVTTKDLHRRAEKLALSRAALSGLGMARSAAPRGERVAVQVKGWDARRVVAGIAEQTGLAIAVDDALAEKEVTLDLEGALWDDALALVARQAGGFAWDDGKGSVRLGLVPTVTMEMADADLVVVIDLVARQCGVNVIMGKRLKGAAGVIQASGLPWPVFLRGLVRAHALSLEVHGGDILSFDGP